MWYASTYPRVSLSNIYEDFWSDFFYQTSDVKQPNSDVEDEDNCFRVKIDLPGIDKKDIKVRVENDILIIEGEKKEEERKSKFWHTERNKIEKFKRSFTLADTIDATKLEAKIKHGVLEIVLPKKEDKKIKTFDVEINQG